MKTYIKFNWTNLLQVFEFYLSYNDNFIIQAELRTIDNFFSKSDIKNIFGADD